MDILKDEIFYNIYFRLEGKLNTSENREALEKDEKSFDGISMIKADLYAATIRKWPGRACTQCGRVILSQDINEISKSYHEWKNNDNHLCFSCYRDAPIEPSQSELYDPDYPEEPPVGDESYYDDKDEWS